MRRRGGLFSRPYSAGDRAREPEGPDGHAGAYQDGCRACRGAVAGDEFRSWTSCSAPGDSRASASGDRDRAAAAGAGDQGACAGVAGSEPTGGANDSASCAGTDNRAPAASADNLPACADANHQCEQDHCTYGLHHPVRKAITTSLFAFDRPEISRQ